MYTHGFIWLPTGLGLFRSWLRMFVVVLVGTGWGVSSWRLAGSGKCNMYIKLWLSDLTSRVATFAVL